MLNKQEILDTIQELYSTDIIECALEAYKKWNGLKHGWAAYDVDKKKLVGIALGDGELIEDNSLVFLYKVPKDVWDTVTYEDLLSFDEVDDYESKLDENEHLDVAEYLEEIGADPYERLSNVLDACFDDDINWYNIEEQIDRIIALRGGE